MIVLNFVPIILCMCNDMLWFHFLFSGFLALQWSISKALIEEQLRVPLFDSSNKVPLVAAQKFTYPPYTQSMMLNNRIMVVFCASFILLFWGNELVRLSECLIAQLLSSKGIILYRSVRCQCSRDAFQDIQFTLIDKIHFTINKSQHS